MLVGAFRVSRFNLAASIRLQRSALHSPFKERDSAERPGGLLLLAIEEAGAAARDNNRLWLAEPPVAGPAARDNNRLWLAEPPVAHGTTTACGWQA